MITYISLLRAINVSGQNTIRMPDLKDLYESLNLQNVVTYAQSGNIIFDSSEIAPRLEDRIKAAIARSFGYDVHIILRDKHQLKLIFDSNPFITISKVDPVKLYVTFLSDAPTEELLNKIPPAKGDDEYRVSGREIYLHCPHGYGKTKLSNIFFEKKLGVIATTRNWKTVYALYSFINLRS